MFPLMTVVMGAEVGECRVKTSMTNTRDSSVDPVVRLLQYECIEYVYCIDDINLHQKVGKKVIPQLLIPCIIFM
jgi:hypothetical protein